MASLQNGSPARIDLAVELLCSGYRYAKVRSTLVTKFEISERHAENYIAKAYELLAEIEAEARPKKKAKLEGFLLRIMRKAEQGGKYRDATDAAKLYSRINGLEQPAQINLTATATVGVDAAAVAGVRELTSAERRKRIGELKAKEKAEGGGDSPAPKKKKPTAKKKAKKKRGK